MERFLACNFPECLDADGVCKRKKPYQGKPTPSMDDKDQPSPPVRCTPQYLLDVEAGINRLGRPTYKGGEA